jgi:hypothetical protein
MEAALSPTPFSKALSSEDSPMEMFFNCPKMSQNASLTNLTFWFLNSSTIPFAMADLRSKTFNNLYYTIVLILCLK